MQVVRGANLVLAFLLELALLAALVVFGLRLEVPWPVRIAVAVLLPAAVVVVWSLFFAPRARRRLGPGPRLLLETALFGVAVLALALTGLPMPAVVLAVLVAVNLVLRVRLRQY